MATDNKRGFNVNRFRSTISEKDILRNNRFLMEFQLPRGLTQRQPENYQRNVSTVRELEYWCEISAIPGINLLTTDGRKYTYGPMQKRPYVTGFTDINVSFFDDGNSDIFKFFNDWLRMINYSTLSEDDGQLYQLGFTGTQQPYELSYRDDYITDARLYIYNNIGTVSRTIVFRDIFPISIADSNLSWTNVNEVLRLGVNFHFLEWYELTHVENRAQK